MDAPWFIVVALLAFGAIALFSWLSSQKRKKDLAAWAAAHGLNFDDAQYRGLDDQFPQFDCFRQGGSRYAYNVMGGHWNERPFLGFDYHYVTGSGKDRHSHLFSAVILQSAVPLKPLFIRTEGLFDKVASFFGHEDINFESAEFSRRFFVRSPDRRWAYDVIHTRTMELLLASPVFSIQFSSTHVIAYRSVQFAPDEFSSATELAGGILDLLPDYLLRQQTVGS